MTAFVNMLKIHRFFVFLVSKAIGVFKVRIQKKLSMSERGPNRVALGISSFNVLNASMFEELGFQSPHN